MSSLPPRKSCQRRNGLLLLVAVMRHWHHSWRKLRPVARSSKWAAAARLNLSSAWSSGKTALSRTSMTNRLEDSNGTSAALKIAASGERAIADGLHVESDRDRKPQAARSMSRSNQGRPLEASHFQLQEGGPKNRALRAR